MHCGGKLPQEAHMKKKDHLQIGKLLLAQKDAKLSGIQRLAFLFGCVEPDINPFTYARGSPVRALLMTCSYRPWCNI